MGNHPNRAKIKHWSEHLKRFRSTHNLSQKQLADALMVSVRLVENWEENINRPPAYLKHALTQIALRGMKGEE